MTSGSKSPFCVKESKNKNNKICEIRGKVDSLSYFTEGDILSVSVH